MSDVVEAAKQPTPKNQYRSKHMAQSGDHQLVRNNSDSKTMLAQQGLNDADKPKSSCSKKVLICVGLMTLSLILAAAFLIAIFQFRVLDKENPCSDSPLKQPQNYKQFATKTTYRNAYEILNSGSALPNIFSSDSLESLNKQLLDQKCQPRQIHYFGRHAARFPNQKGIQNINSGIRQIIDKIDLTKFSPNYDNLVSTQDAPVITGNATSDCLNPMEPYKAWKSFATDDQENLVTDTGAEETADIYHRLKIIYPELFNKSQTAFNISITDKIRTAQTALVFMKLLDYQPPDTCPLGQYPHDNLSNKENAQAISGDPCLNKLIEKRRWADLSFHERCESISENKKKEEDSVDTFKPFHLDQYKKPIASSVSKKLKLTENSVLTVEELDVLYDTCRYETAILNSSVWCSLFSTEDLMFLEYLKDFGDFYSHAYGHLSQHQSACVLTSPLWFKLNQLIKNATSRPKQEANFHFTHAQAIQRLVAAIIDLSEEPAYSRPSANNILKSGKAPQTRQWRTSLISPFSANLALTLYECLEPTSAEASGSMMNVNPSRLRLVASLNEKPILMNGCQTYDCDLDIFLHHTRVSITKGQYCDLEKICKEKFRFS